MFFTLIPFHVSLFYIIFRFFWTITSTLYFESFAMLLILNRAIKLPLLLPDMEVQATEMIKSTVVLSCIYVLFRYILLQICFPFQVVHYVTFAIEY